MVGRDCTHHPEKRISTGVGKPAEHSKHLMWRRAERGGGTPDAIRIVPHKGSDSSRPADGKPMLDRRLPLWPNYRKQSQCQKSAAASYIQRAVATARVRRFAAILTRLPAELQHHVVKSIDGPTNSGRTSRTVARIVINRFVKLNAFECELDISALRQAYELATRNALTLSHDDRLLLLRASLHFLDRRCFVDQRLKLSRAWHDCRSAMYSFCISVKAGGQSVGERWQRRCLVWAAPQHVHRSMVWTSILSLENHRRAEMRRELTKA